MTIPVEITITLKDDERTYKEKFLTYETCLVNVATLTECVDKAKAGFKGEPEKILVKATFEYNND